MIYTTDFNEELLRKWKHLRFLNRAIGPYAYYLLLVAATKASQLSGAGVVMATQGGYCSLRIGDIILLKRDGKPREQEANVAPGITTGYVFSELRR